MDLTDKQRKELREEIETRLSEDKLKNIFLENEQKFGKNFYNQISGSDYRTRVTNTVRELDNRNYIALFITVVRQDNPLFARDLVEECRAIQCSLKIYKKLSELILILQEITPLNYTWQRFQYSNFEELEIDLLKKIERDRALLSSLENSEAWNLSSACPVLKDFVKDFGVNLLTSEDIHLPLKQKLKQWIEQNYPDLDCSTEARSHSTLQSYLLISIYPLKGKTRTTRKKTFNIQAELIEDFPNTSNQPIDLNSEDAKKEGYLEKEIPDTIHEFIKIAEEKTLGLKVSQGQPYDLKIELFLTTDLLTKRFEFKIPQAWKKDKLSICEKHSVTLRSLNRLVKTDWQNACLKKWQQMPALQPGQIYDFDNDEDLQRLLSNSTQKKQLRLKLEQLIVVKVCCCLTPRKIKDFFEILLEKGIPLCFWLRNKEVFNIDLLNELTKRENLANLNGLHQEIFRIRREDLAEQNKKNLLGYNLGFFCDSIDRNPVNLPKFNQLAS